MSMAKMRDAPALTAACCPCRTSGQLGTLKSRAVQATRMRSRTKPGLHVIQMPSRLRPVSDEHCQARPALHPGWTGADNHPQRDAPR